MAAEIKWSDNAIHDYHLIIEYLLTDWDEGIALRFIEIAEHRVRQIAIHPYVGMVTATTTDIRSVLITKHNRLYYKILTAESIEIVNIFDTRQNPSKNRFE